MSQQEGESSSVNITDGTEETEFDIKPIDYDDGRHFFLGYYFRNRWEPSLSDPPRILLANGFQRITEIEIWRFEQTNPEDDDVREVVAMVDLGESETILTAANEYTETGLADLPDAANDQYTDADIATLRDRNTSADGFLGAAGKGLNERSDFQTGPFKKLVRDRDYTVNEQLGYVTLSQRLQDSEAIAVSFRYIANGLGAERRGSIYRERWRKPEHPHGSEAAPTTEPRPAGTIPESGRLVPGDAKHLQHPRSRYQREWV